jgi:hypothetical protein
MVEFENEQLEGVQQGKFLKVTEAILCQNFQTSKIK